MWIAVLACCDCVLTLRMIGLGKGRTGFHPASMTGACGASLRMGVRRKWTTADAGMEMVVAVVRFADGEGWGSGGRVSGM